jgi:hypothetical protein
VALALGASCLVLLVAGLLVEVGTTLVGLAVVAGVLALVALGDGSLRRLRARRRRPGAR